MHLEGPFTMERFYPTPTGRASLNLSVPYEDFSPRASASLSAGPPLMGFLTTVDKSTAAIALQSVKEPEGRLVSLENCLPPWGLCPESDLTSEKVS
jgi:hypothetical protein